MTNCIDRDMLLKMISHKPSSPTTDREDRLIDGFISAVKNCPAADVRPVARWRWIKCVGENGVTSSCRCNLCGFEDNRFSVFNYCPNCGADMRPEPPKEE